MFRFITKDTMALADEIRRVQALSRSMIDAYLEWGKKREWADTYSAIYGEITDFVNFRVETADSCLKLIEEGKVADALGLCRSLLENYLLFMLICRGEKYFRLQHLESKTPTEIKTYLREQQSDLADKHAKGESLTCLYVEKYPRENKSLMYVFEGLVAESEPDFKIPIHYFQFQDFRPMTMRLRDEDYFDYYEPPETVSEARSRFRREAAFSYRHYLSYDALLQCLLINDLVDDGAIKRIDAHYTFLGTFLHPTHDAARDLHERSNYHSGEPAIGKDSPYEESAALIASCYVAYLLAGFFDEISSLIEAAPPKYVKKAGTEDLRELTRSVPATIEYLWFIYNEAPLYDRFNHAIHHVNDVDLARFGGYEGVPSSLIKFNSQIYGTFKRRLDGWSNDRVGKYEPQLGAK